MRENHSEFTTEWLVRASLVGVNDVLGDARSLPRWWPSVYLEAKLLESGAPSDHEGAVIALRTRGALPYILRWRMRLIENRAPLDSTVASPVHSSVTKSGYSTTCSATRLTECLDDLFGAQ